MAPRRVGEGKKEQGENYMLRRCMHWQNERLAMECIAPPTYPLRIRCCHPHPLASFLAGKACLGYQ